MDSSLKWFAADYGAPHEWVMRGLRHRGRGHTNMAIQGVNMKRFSRFAPAWALALVAAVCLSSVARAQVLQQVPSDALVVLRGPITNPNAAI